MVNDAAVRRLIGLRICAVRRQEFAAVLGICAVGSHMLFVVGGESI